MDATPVPVHPRLLRALRQPHDAAFAVLGGSPADSLAAVTWIATHLGATSRVLHRSVAARLPGGSSRLHPLVEADRRLQRALWRLDRRLTGDVHLAAGGVPDLAAAVAGALEEHVRHETAVMEALAPLLREPEQVQLAERLEQAMRRAPTRPHPDAPVRGPMAGLTYLIDSGADRVRDLLDNRDVPSPHDVPVPRVPGRWGSYMMGRPFSPERDPE